MNSQNLIRLEKELRREKDNFISEMYEEFDLTSAEMKAWYLKLEVLCDISSEYGRLVYRTNVGER